MLIQHSNVKHKHYKMVERINITEVKTNSFLPRNQNKLNALPKNSLQERYQSYLRTQCMCTLNPRNCEAWLSTAVPNIREQCLMETSVFQDYCLLKTNLETSVIHLFITIFIINIILNLH